MSVALECLKGDPFYCLESFYGCPQGEPFSWKRSRRFKVGERLYFVSAYLDEHFKEHPTGWMIVFDAADGKRYAATQIYFVTEECWEGLKAHLAGKARKAAPVKKTKVARQRSIAKKKHPVASGSKKRRIA